MTRQIPLIDGRTVGVREAHNSDVELFLGFFAGLSASSRDFMRGWTGDNACTLEHAESLARKTPGR